MCYPALICLRYEEKIMCHVISLFQQFRHLLHRFFPSRADAAIELVDALSGNTHADSVIQLSLNPLFRRQYSSITDAIDNLDLANQKYRKELQHLLLSHCPKPTQRPYYLFGMDCTAYPRPYAKTVPERSYIHSNEPTPGQKPIKIGHDYSLLALLPEKTQAGEAPWIYPLSMRRVSTTEKGTDIGLEQLLSVTEELSDHLCVSVADAAYSSKKNLANADTVDNLVYISRLRSNACLYQSIDADQKETKQRGHPRWYGKPFKLNDKTTWIAPDEQHTVPWQTKKKRDLVVHIESWNNLHLKGSKTLAMHTIPLRILKITVRDKNNNLVYQRPLWLVVAGKKRYELTLQQTWEAYRQRFDVEHYFRFNKKRLLLVSYQTPEIEHEETFVTLSMLAYIQLFLARDIAQTHVYPWERYLKKSVATEDTQPLSPSQVQRDYTHIIRNIIGTPALPPKPRGLPKGRCVGATQPVRVRFPIVRKAKSMIEENETSSTKKAVALFEKSTKEIKCAFEKEPEHLKQALKSSIHKIFNISRQEDVEMFFAMLGQQEKTVQNQQKTGDPPA
jgi:hypothetical protein